MTADSGEKYVDADGRLDIDAVRADHQPDDSGEWCATCDSEYPCSFAWAADRAEGFRERRQEAPVPGGAGEQEEQQC